MVIEPVYQSVMI